MYEPFEKQYNVKVVLDTGNGQERYTKLLNDPNSTVDVIELAQKNVADGVAAGLFDPIKPEEVTDFASLIPAAQQIIKSGSGAPYTLNSIGIFYNPKAAGMVKGDVLPVIFFAILFGIGVSYLMVSEDERMLRNGEIDLLTSATKTPEREVDFAFSENSIGTSSAILTVKAGNTTYFADDYSNWNGIRVGLLQGNSRNDSFDQFAVRNGFWYRPVYFNSQDELTENLASGTIDAIVTSNLRQIKDEWLIAQFDPKPFYVIVKKGNTELLNEVNAALAQVAEIERNLDEELFGKYYSPDNGDQIAFTSEERAFIRECQKDGTVFNALFNPVLQPLSYVGQDGTYHAGRHRAPEVSGKRLPAGASLHRQPGDRL